MAEEVRTVSSTGGEKGTKLARFDLIPVDVLNLLAEHFGRGARKYEDRNWERGYEWGKGYAALCRHLVAYWGGEDFDEETGSLHLIAVAWHAFALAHFSINNQYAEFDDRPSTEDYRLDELTHEAEDLGLYDDPYTWTAFKGDVQDAYDAVSGVNPVSKGRYKGSDNPIAHDGEPVYRKAAVETLPPSVVRDTGQMPYSRPNYLKDSTGKSWEQIFREQQDKRMERTKKNVVDL